MEQEELQPAGQGHFAQEGMNARSLDLFLRQAADETHDLPAKDLQPGQDFLQRQATPFLPGGILLGPVAPQVRRVLLEDSAGPIKEDGVVAGQMRQVLTSGPLARSGAAAAASSPAPANRPGITSS